MTRPSALPGHNTSPKTPTIARPGDLTSTPFIHADNNTRKSATTHGIPPKIVRPTNPVIADTRLRSQRRRRAAGSGRRQRPRATAAAVAACRRPRRRRGRRDGGGPQSPGRDFPSRRTPRVFHRVYAGKGCRRMRSWEQASNTICRAQANRHPPPPTRRSQEGRPGKPA